MKIFVRLFFNSSYIFLHFITPSFIRSYNSLVSLLLCCVLSYLLRIFERKCFPQLVQLEQKNWNERLQRIVIQANRQTVHELLRTLGMSLEQLISKCMKLLSIVNLCLYRGFPMYVVYLMLSFFVVEEKVSLNIKFIVMVVSGSIELFIFAKDFLSGPNLAYNQLWTQHPKMYDLDKCLDCYTSYLCNCLKMYILFYHSFLEFLLVQILHFSFVVYIHV
jgi:hypothetical protein